MTKITSKYGKDYNYDYYTIHINLDRNDPYQKKCIDILSKVGRKKSQLIAILINQFLSNFNDPDSISEKDLKNYLDYYELATKMKTPMSLPNNGLLMGMPNAAISSAIPENNSSIPDYPEEEASPPIDSEGIMNAMNVFTV